MREAIILAAPFVIVLAALVGVCSSISLRRAHNSCRSNRPIPLPHPRAALVAPEERGHADVQSGVHSDLGVKFECPALRGGGVAFSATNGENPDWNYETAAASAAFSLDGIANR
jgi:hypothetical protein